MTKMPVRAIQLDVPNSAAYSLESVGKHGFGNFKWGMQANGFIFVWTCADCSLFAAIEVGPQPNGVLRADIYNVVKTAVDLTITWLHEFNSGEKQTDNV